MAQTLNRLTRDVQGLRQETETQIGTDVTNLNQMLPTLDQVNGRLKDISGDDAAAARRCSTSATGWCPRSPS